MRSIAEPYAVFKKLKLQIEESLVINSTNLSSFYDLLIQEFKKTSFYINNQKNINAKTVPEESSLGPSDHIMLIRACVYMAANSYEVINYKRMSEYLMEALPSLKVLSHQTSFSKIITFHDILALHNRCLKLKSNTIQKQIATLCLHQARLHQGALHCQVEKKKDDGLSNLEAALALLELNPTRSGQNPNFIEQVSPPTQKITQMFVQLLQTTPDSEKQRFLVTKPSDRERILRVLLHIGGLPYSDKSEWNAVKTLLLWGEDLMETFPDHKKNYSKAIETVLINVHDQYEKIHDQKSEEKTVSLIASLASNLSNLFDSVVSTKFTSLNQDNLYGEESDDQSYDSQDSSGIGLAVYSEADDGTSSSDDFSV